MDWTWCLRNALAHMLSDRRNLIVAERGGLAHHCEPKRVIRTDGLLCKHAL